MLLALLLSALFGGMHAMLRQSSLASLAAELRVARMPPNRAARTRLVSLDSRAQPFFDAMLRQSSLASLAAELRVDALPVAPSSVISAEWRA